MSIYSNVNQEDLNNLSQLPEQQKEQRAIKIKNRILKQTHDEELAKAFAPITNKLEKINESTKNLNPKYLLFQNQLPEGVTLSDSLVMTFPNMNQSKNFFKAVRNDEGKLSWNNKVIEPLGGNKIKIDNKEFTLTPDIQKAMTATDYNFRNMNDEDILNFANILKTVDYNSKQDFNSTRSKYIKNNLQNRVDRILNPTLSLPTTSSLPTKSLVTSSLPASEIESSDDHLEGSGISKIIIPSNIIEME